MLPKLLGAFFYMVTCSRPADLAFITTWLARFMSNPRWWHWQALKRLLRYLRGTSTLALEFKRNSSNTNVELIGFADADWAGDRTTRKSTTGYCFTLCGSLISWKTSTQKSVALSTAEAELYALAKTSCHAVWLQRLAANLGFNIRPIKIHEDNQATIAIVKGDDKFNDRLKHIDIKYFFIRDKIQGGDIAVVPIATEHQLADIFTKLMVGVRFTTLRAKIGMVFLQ
jgi:hypothetical protein